MASTEVNFIHLDHEAEGGPKGWVWELLDGGEIVDASRTTFASRDAAVRDYAELYAEEVWGVWCMRGAGSVFGAAEGWERDGDGFWSGTEEEARERAAKYCNDRHSRNVWYEARIKG